MRAPCVRVPETEGETTRRDLVDAELLDHELEITAEDGWLYLPVTDPDAAAAGYEVTERKFEPRETQILPADLLDVTPSYERIGDVVLLHEEDAQRAQTIADAVMDSNLPVASVLNRASEVRGIERVRDWEVLAGEGTETTHREYGCEFAVDLARMYFSARLATERQRVVNQVEPGERVFDMFAGAGPFAVRLADAGAEVIAVDVNPAAIEYLEANARQNDVGDRTTIVQGDVRDVAAEYVGWADRIVMNLPHSAEAFLQAAVRIAGDNCLVHYYDIQPEAAPYASGEAAIREAAGDEYTVEIADRRVVRSYAPGQVNVCIEACLRRA